MIAVTIFGGLLLFTLVALNFGANARTHPIPWYIPSLFWLLIGGAISGRSYFSSKKEIIAGSRRLEEALQSKTAHEVRIRSSEFVEIEEYEDEGACYAFQLDGGNIVFVSGQDFYESLRFPTSDFSLITFRSNDGIASGPFLKKRGTKIKPIQRVPGQIKYKWKIPSNLDLIDGDLSQIERLLT